MQNYAATLTVSERHQFIQKRLMFI